MAHLLILAGAAMWAVSFGGRAIIRRARINKINAQDLFGNTRRVERYKQAFEDPMTRREAALILGVDVSAREEEVQQAYKTLIILNHPDRGGSGYMAMKINQAKDLMLIK